MCDVQAASGASHACNVQAHPEHRIELSLPRCRLRIAASPRSPVWPHPTPAHEVPSQVTASKATKQ